MAPWRHVGLDDHDTDDHDHPDHNADHNDDPDDDTDDPDHHDHDDHAEPIAIGIRIGLARDAELRGTVVQPVTDDRDHEPVAVRQRLVGSPSG